MTVPTATLNDILDDRYNGVTATFYLTDGLTYDANTTLANVTSASVLSTTKVLGAASGGVTTTTDIVFTNSTGSTQSFTGIGFTIDGSTLEEGNNNVNSSVADGNTYTVNLTSTLT